MKRMSAEQLKAWRDHYAPRDKAFHEAKLSGKELVRWKFQRYAKNYLRCVKGVDESVDRLQKELKKLGLDKIQLLFIPQIRVFTSEITAGMTSDGCTKNLSKCHLLSNGQGW